MNLDETAAIQFRSRLAQARQHLQRLMAEHGLREADGWRVHEFVRVVADGMELVLRPVHTRLPSPQGLECVVKIEEETQEVDLTCQPGQA